MAKVDPHRLKLSQLRALVAIADRGSFSEAALHLELSQSAVSHAIATLEDELGVLLLNRGRQGAVLTPVGELITDDARQMLRSLQEWERLRLRVDPTTRNINFLADVIGESCVPAGADSDLIWRWESLAQSLDMGLGEQLAKTDTLTLAYRDLAALAAARPACILTHCSETEATQNQPPRICTTLQQWDIPCQEIAPKNPIVDIEREQFRNLLVHAGVSKLLWAGLQLVVLHLVVPAAATVSSSQNWSDAYGFFEINQADSTPDNLINLWDGAQGFWYLI